MELEVTPDVVPRPETELLVELALAAIAGLESPAVLDLGTGSGALRSRSPLSAGCRGHRHRRQRRRAGVAQRNAAGLGLRNLRFCEGDWYTPLAGARFDAIVSNPPYVAAADPPLRWRMSCGSRRRRRRRSRGPRRRCVGRRAISCREAGSSSNTARARAPFAACCSPRALRKSRPVPTSPALIA
jgi:hypothetical protein